MQFDSMRLGRYIEPLRLHEWVNAIGSWAKQENMRRVAFSALDILNRDRPEHIDPVAESGRMIADHIWQSLEKFSVGYIVAAYELMWLLASDGTISFENAGRAFANDGLLDYPHEGESPWEIYRRNKIIVQIRQVCPYREVFLKTTYWRRIRAAELFRAGYRCEHCGATRDDAVLHVHHTTYKNRGNEQPGDLKVLCADCHSDAHTVSKISKTEQWISYLRAEQGATDDSPIIQRNIMRLSELRGRLTNTSECAGTDGVGR